MALNWSWSEKCGEAVFEQNGKEFTTSLYQGNAYLIFIYEFEENGDKMYNLWTFWADKEHAKRCLGLAKGDEYYNLYNDGIDILKKIRINKEKYHKASELVGLLVKAFDDLAIEIYSDGADN